MSKTDYLPVDSDYPYLKVHAKWGTFYYLRKIDGDEEKYSFKTKDEREAKRLYDRDYGQTRAPNRISSCNKAWDLFIDRPGREDSTKARYKVAWKYARRIIGPLAPNDVKPEHVLNVYEAALASGKIRKGCQGEPLSDSSMKKIEIALSAFFKAMTAVPLRCRDERFPNPVTLCRDELTRLLDERAADEHEGMLEDDEIGEVVQVLSQSEQLALALAAGTPEAPDQWPSQLVARQLSTLVLLGPEIGWRISEALGAKVSDFRPDAKTPHIQVVRQLRFNFKADDPRTWTKALKGSGFKQGDKKRPVPLRPETVAILQAYIAEGLEGGWLQEQGLLFPNSQGKPRNAAKVGTQISEAAKKAKIGRRIVSHYFRHSYASREYARGVETKTIARRMGDTIKVVESTYLHIEEREAEALWDAETL